MAKQGSIKHYRQTGTAKAPPSLPFGELAVAKDGTLFVGNASNAAIPAGVQVYIHAYDAVAKRHNFTGSGGENGRALVTANVKPGDSFAVNGKAVAAYIGGDEADELPVGRWVSFIFDGTQLNFKSGGAALNLKVVSGTTQPASARDYTVWLNTSVALGKITWGYDVPSAPANGDVFIRLGGSASIPIPTGRKNVVWLLPIDAQQYVGGVWTARAAKTFFSGMWHDWKIVLYNRGDQCTGTTGGWSREISYRYFGGSSTVTQFGMSDTYFGYYGSMSGTAYYRCHNNPVDLTNMKTLYLEWRIAGNSNALSSASCHLIVTKTTDIVRDDSGGTNSAASIEISPTGDSTYTRTMDVSALTGNYYIVPLSRGAHAGYWSLMYVFKLWVEA